MELVVIKKFKALFIRQPEKDIQMRKKDQRLAEMRVCGFPAIVEQMKQQNLARPNNQVKPTFRKPKALLYNGEEIIGIKRHPDGSAFTITLASGKQEQISSSEGYELVGQNP